MHKSLGRIAHAKADVETARQHFESARDLVQGTADLASCHEDLAMLHMENQEFELAGDLMLIATSASEADRESARARILDRSHSSGLSLGHDMVVMGSSPDYWTRGTSAAGLIVRNSGTTQKPAEFRLACLADHGTLPIIVYVDDGEKIQQHVFEQPGFLTVRLGSVKPGGERLFVVWTSKDWSPGGGDNRRLGVKFFPKG